MSRPLTGVAPVKLAFQALILGLASMLAGVAQADGPGKGIAGEPDAKQRLDRLIAAYKAIPGYADHGEVTLVVKGGERTLKQVQRASVTFSRPNKLDVQTDLVRVVCDGATVTSTVNPLKKYQATPAPRKFSEGMLRGGPLGAIEFGGVSGLPLVHVLNLVIGVDPERLIEDFAPKLVIEADQVVGETTYQVLRFDEADNDDWRLLIDPKTGLLGHVDLVVEGQAARSSIAGTTTHVESLRWSAGAVSTETLKDEVFGFKPPEGYSSVAKLEGTAEKAKARGQDHELVGKPAPDFTLDVLDGPDKFRKVTKADLAGKVVLLDFWATWCGPCLAELPDVQKLIESYGKARKDVVIVALSIDQIETGDLKEARAKVEETLKQRKITLSFDGNPVGQIALDPLQKIATTYGANAIPFVVLIDAKGVIQAVHIGLTDGETFAEEIDAVLNGKAPSIPR